MRDKWISIASFMIFTRSNLIMDHIMLLILSSSINQSRLSIPSKGFRHLTFDTFYF